jgi:uncharacterized protein (DUF362 family)
MKGAANGSLVVSLGGCGSNSTGASQNDWPDKGIVGGDDVLFGLYPSSRVARAEDAVRQACAKLDFSWLKAGDSVLIKIASNSGNVHPAVTSPAAVRGLVAELKARGAKRVVVGEQSGVESVRLVAGEKRFKSTKELLAKNGLLAAIGESGAEGHFFDDQGYDKGYFEATPPAGSHWQQKMMLPNIIREVDHIVYLPRLSSHVLAGYTHGLKIAVGWLRDDSRNHLHLDAASFYEKYVEVNYVKEIRDRFRLVLTLAEAMLLHAGPDKGTVHTLDPRLVIASRNLASHDAIASGVLLHASGLVEPATQGGIPYSPNTADGINKLFVTQFVTSATGIPWGPGDPASYTQLKAHAFEKNASSDRAIARAFAISGTPSKIRAVVVAEPPDGALSEKVTAHGEGRVAFA